MHDAVITDLNSRVQLQFEDQSFLNLSGDGHIIIDKYIYHPEKSSGSLELQTLKGAFRFLSGKIATKTPDNILFKTPVGTIGIRGTHFMAHVTDTETNCITLLPQPANDRKPTAIIVGNKMGSVTIDQLYFASDLLSLGQLPTSPKKESTPELIKNLHYINGNLEIWPNF